MVAAEQRFYVTGGTLPTDAPSYVARRADTDLLETLRRGEFCYVLDTRQMGESSLMVRAAQGVQRRQSALLPGEAGDQNSARMLIGTAIRA